jgi:hypothetical protein
MKSTLRYSRLFLAVTLLMVLSVAPTSSTHTDLHAETIVRSVYAEAHLEIKDKWNEVQQTDDSLVLQELEMLVGTTLDTINVIGPRPCYQEWWSYAHGAIDTFRWALLARRAGEDELFESFFNASIVNLSLAEVTPNSQEC